MKPDNENIMVMANMMIVYRKEWNSIKKRLNQMNITYMMANVCGVVWFSPGISQDGVAQTLIIDKSSVAKIISKAQKEKLIRRKVNEKDKRSYHLYLTDKGNKVMQEIINVIDEWEKEVCKNISDEEMTAFKSVLTKIEKGLSNHSDILPNS